MTIYFKDVGQGDSIIIEWEEDDKIKIGIIDCNKKKGINPVIEHLRARENFTIEFIFLSHPHEDHFSGIPELLNYLKKKNIVITHFLHTCVSKKEYLQSSVRSIIDKNILSSIFRLVTQMRHSGLISNSGFVNDLTSEISIGEKIKLKIIAPSDAEYSQFNKSAFKNDSPFNNNPNSNFLSTVIKMYSANWFCLFTSDATKRVFWRLNRGGIMLNENHFLFGQIPHHGSSGNYYSTFWRLMNNNNSSFAVISVGDNSYNHPAKSVLHDLKLNSYTTRLTNFKDLSYSPHNKELSDSLDLISEKISNQTFTQNSDDVIFKIIDNKLIEVI